MKLQQGRSFRGPLGKTTTGRADILQLNRHSDKKLLRLGNDDDDDEEALVSKRHSLSPEKFPLTTLKSLSDKNNGC